MKIWLDDIRTPVGSGWQWVKTSHEAMNFVQTGRVTEISLDHDLGNDVVFGTGYDVATFIEEYAYNGGNRIKWNIHSANPVGRQRMTMALENADRFWK